MHVVVVGCGRVGAELSQALTKDGHSVAVIDKSPKSLLRLPSDWPGRKVVGFGFDRDALEEADITHADALAAVTSGDNSNILTARIAHETYQVPNVVARIYDPRRAAIYRRLGIPTVATVTWTVDQAIRRLIPDRLVTEWSEPSGKVVLLERMLPATWVGQRLDGLELPGKARLVSITRAGIPLLARQGLIGQQGDVIYVAVLTVAMEEFRRCLARGPTE
jgi:trk system potassium uptake protein TrkA